MYNQGSEFRQGKEEDRGQNLYPSFNIKSGKGLGREEPAKETEKE